MITSSLPLISASELELLIDRSHKRSSSYGIDPKQKGAPESSKISESELKKRIEQRKDFYSVAKFELDALYGLLRGTGFCSALADNDGYVLYTTGDQDILEQYIQRRCLPGYRWSEKDMGTCAIGMALEEQVPVFLPGEKMYVASTRKISNAGAPVFSPDGETLLGILCLSGYSEKMHIHTLGLVRQSADRITSVLREKEHQSELELQNRYMKAVLESHSQGIVTINSSGRILRTSERARQLLQINPDEKGGIADFLSIDKSITTRIASGVGIKSMEMFSHSSQKTFFVSVDPIFTDKQEPAGSLIRLTEKEELMQVASKLAGATASFTFDSILGESKQLQSALHYAKISSSSTVSVLLYGETGTGKELFAQAIHNESDRCDHPFVAINCGAIPRELLESELFGYVEGAFTGAQKGGRPGKLELANQGTLFLDELGDMPLDMQVKLLRVLQTGELQRLGSSRTVPVDLRIISATNLDLERAMAESKFRDDLYYRICTLKIEIPSLRNREDDPLLLAEYFLKKHCQELQKDLTLTDGLSREAIQNYSWPGNIRELENAVERAAHLAPEGSLLPEHLGIEDSKRSTDHTSGNLSFPKGTTLAEMEKQFLITTLNMLQGNIRQAANELGISRPTIYRKLKQYNISKDDLNRPTW